MINILPNQAVKLNYSVIQGTTPTFNLRIPATLDQSIISDVCIVFAQQRPIFSLSLSDCTLQDQVLSFTLTQQQTYNFRVGFPLLIQINVLATGGQVLASYIFSEEVKPNLCQSPFGASIAGQQPDPNVVDSTSSGLSSSEQRIGIDFGQIQNISGYVQAGEYDAQTLYTAGQVVTYNGSSYVAKQATVGNLPTDTTYWQLVASKGDDGYSPTITVKTDTDTEYVLTITDENGSYDTPNLKATIPNESVVSGITLTYDGDEVNFVESTINLLTGQTGTEEVNIALANSQNAGLMSPASVEAIQQLTSDVAVLKGQTVRLAYDVKTDPTAQEIQAFVISEGYTDQSEWVHIAVVVVDTNYVWRYYTDDGWMQQTDTVSQWTNSVAGIILGSELDGQIYAEDNGTGSVVGWNTVKTDISNLQTGKVAKPISVISGNIVYWDGTNQVLGDSGISPSNIVTLSGSQTISGVKTFSSGGDLYTIVEDDGVIVGTEDSTEEVAETQYANGYIYISTQSDSYDLELPKQSGTLAVTSDIPTTLAELTGDSTHRTVTDVQIAAWDAKQNALTFDNTPTSGSTNPVTSGGVYTALGDKVDKVSTAYRLYGTGAAGVETTYGIDLRATGSSVPVRGGTGTIKVGTPTENNDATTKNYVDSNLPVIQDWTV